MRSETRAATLALSRFLGTVAGRRAMDEWRATNPVVVPAHHADSIDSVVGRVMRHDPPVVVAVHFPERPVPVILLKLEPSAEIATAPRRVGRTATIGMLTDSLKHGQPEALQFVWTGSRSFAYTATPELV